MSECQNASRVKRRECQIPPPSALSSISHADTLPSVHHLHSGSFACLKFKAQTWDAKFAFWVFCLPKIQGPNLGCKVCILGLLPAEKFKAQTLDAKFAFWVFCLPKIQGPNLGCKVCILVSSACLKFKAQTLDAKCVFWCLLPA